MYGLFREAAQSRVAAIGVELEERESSLRQQLQQQQASAASQISNLTAEVARLTHELDVSLSQASLLMHLLSLGISNHAGPRLLTPSCLLHSGNGICQHTLLKTFFVDTCQR